MLMQSLPAPIVTLTNAGYVPYTLNCLGSLRALGLESRVVCYCIGLKSYDAILRAGYTAILIADEAVVEMQQFRVGAWANVTFYKFQAIFEQLERHPYVFFTDGDIYFEDRAFYDYCLSRIGVHDLLIQNDLLHDTDDGELCTGFMLIKSTDRTRRLLAPNVVRTTATITTGWDDQVYVNAIKDQLSYQLLPLDLFPNGRYYRAYASTMSPHLVHFNWVIGRNKAFDIVRYRKYASMADAGRMAIEASRWLSARLATFLKKKLYALASLPAKQLAKRIGQARGPSSQRRT